MSRQTGLWTESHLDSTEHVFLEPLRRRVAELQDSVEANDVDDVDHMKDQIKVESENLECSGIGYSWSVMVSRCGMRIFFHYS